MEYYSAIKKNETLPFGMKWMELEYFMLSEISQSEKKTPYDFIHMWNLRNETDEHGGKKEANQKNSLWLQRVGVGEAGGGVS